jgi:hypothetical protein
MVNYPIISFLGDEPMRMRLKPSIKYDIKGNRIHYGKRRKWYAHFQHNGQQIGNSLNAYEPEEKKAQVELGRLIEKIENGIVVGGVNKKIKLLISDPQSFFTKDLVGKWTKWIVPLLGEYRVGDLTKEIMEGYMEARWGLNEDGELQVVHSTFDKELIVLQQGLRTVSPKMSVKQDLIEGIKYNKMVKEQLPPLTPEQLYQATLHAKGYWGDIFLIMLYTGMEARDIYDLKPEHIKNGFIKKLRHKNKFKTKQTNIDMPICSALDKILKKLPTPVSKSQPFLEGYEPWKVSKKIKDIFKNAGLEGYGSKSLRRYVGEEINSQFMQEANRMAKEALAHSENSKETARYTRPKAVDLNNLMNQLVERIAQAGSD